MVLITLAFYRSVYRLLGNDLRRLAGSLAGSLTGIERIKDGGTYKNREQERYGIDTYAKKQGLKTT